MATVRRRRGEWVIDYYDEKKQRHIFQVESQEEGFKRLAEIEGSGRKAPNKQTFKEYGEWWLKNCAKGSIKESTYEEYDRALESHLYPVFGSKLMTKIKRSDVREFVTGKINGSEGRNNKGLSRSSIRNILAPMRAMFNQMIEDEEFNFNPAANIGKLNKKKESNGEEIEVVKEENVYDMGQVVKVLDKARETKPADHSVFACGFLSGLRMGEQIALRPMDIDFESHVIAVRRNFYRNRITTPKGNRRRAVDLEPYLEEILAELISSKKAAALREEMKKPAADRRKTEKVIQDVMEGYLFTTPTGSHLDPSNLRRAFLSVLKVTELRRIRYHDMRHSYATNLLRAGVGLDKVKALLGHSSIQITVDTYGHFIPGKERQSTLTDAMAEVRQAK